MSITPSLYHAITLAEQAHNGQERASGEAYIEHPLRVVRILMEASLDLPAEAYVTAILHDVLEETTIAEDDIERFAGADVAAMVRILTKKGNSMLTPPPNPLPPGGGTRFPSPQGRGQGRGVDSNETTYLNQISSALSRFPLLFLVKLADRIHNIETLDALPEERRDKILRETSDLYLPFFRCRIRSLPGGLRRPALDLLYRLSTVLHAATL